MTTRPSKQIPVTPILRAIVTKAALIRTLLQLSRSGFLTSLVIVATTLRKKKREVLGLQVPNDAALGTDDFGGQVAFAILQLEDLLLDGVTGDQPIREDRMLLTNAVSAIHRLCFHGRVPPGIEDEYILGAGKIQPDSACL